MPSDVDPEKNGWDSRELLRVTLASIGDAVIVADRTGRIAFMNSAAESLTGWAGREAAGQPLDRVFRIINEHTRQPVENPVTQAFREGHVVGLANHTVLITLQGDERAIDDSAAPILNEQNQIIGCVLIFRDVTERRRLEQESARRLLATRMLAAIVESSHDAIISKSLEGVIQSWNASAERLLGYTPEEAVGKHISLIIPAERAYEEEQILARIRAGERIEHFDTVRVKRNGQRIHVSLTISPVNDEAGRVIGASKIMRDISDRKEAERRIHELMEALKDADRRKDEFLAMLGHELRNPLAAIRNGIAVASLDESQLPHALEIARRQSDHLGRLIDDLLDVARITHGRIQVRKETVDLADIIESAVESTRSLIKTRGVRLVVSQLPQPVRLDADATRLEQVLVNLLTNAAKFSNAGGVIQLLAEQHGDEAIVRVRDNGIGIAPEMMSHIWDLFAQANPDLDRAQGGLGIGLTVARRIVEIHGGRIEAHSEGIGKGAEFVVTLPAGTQSVEEAQTAQSGESVPPRSARILVVEDNHDAAEALSALLEILGHQVLVAYDGIAAIEAAQTAVPDVMFVDIGLPGMDGYEVARHIRTEPALAGTTLVALSGYGRDEDKQKALVAGFDHHLVKPISPEALNELVMQCAKDDAGQPQR